MSDQGSDTFAISRLKASMLDIATGAYSALRGLPCRTLTPVSDASASIFGLEISSSYPRTAGDMVGTRIGW